MLKIYSVIDYANIMGQLRSVGRKPDLVSLRDCLADPAKGRFAMDMKVYAPLPHQNADGVHRFHDSLRHQGIRVISKRAKKMPDGGHKCNMDIELTLDALEVLSMVHPPDIVVIGTGDGDFSPLSMALRDKGFFVEIAGLPNSVAGELKASAQGFIDLTEWANGCEKLHGDAPELGDRNVFDENLF